MAEDYVIIKCKGCGSWTFFLKHSQGLGPLPSNDKLFDWLDEHSTCHPHYTDSDLDGDPGYELYTEDAIGDELDIKKQDKKPPEKSQAPLRCTFDPNNEELINAALRLKPRASGYYSWYNLTEEVRAAIDHAAAGFRRRLLRMDGADAVMLLRPATKFDAAVIRLVLQEIADRENRQIDIHWAENPKGLSSPDIEWVQP